MDALIIRNGEKRWIMDAIDFKGYLAQVRKVGAGKIIEHKVIVDFDSVDEFDIYERYEDRYQPNFNGQNILKDFSSNDEFKSEFKSYFGCDTMKSDIRNVIGTKFEKYLAKIGNHDGLIVELHDYEKEQKEEQERKWKEMDAEIIERKKAINFVDGVFGFLCTIPVPEPIWGNLMKPYAEYHKGNIEDVENAEDMGYYDMKPIELKGWYYSKEAIDALVKAGYLVSYCKEVITSSFDETFLIVKKKKQERDEKIREFDKKKSQLRAKYYEYLSNSYYMTEKEVEDAKLNGLEQILAPEIGIKGHNIYGGGIYLVKKDNFLYFIKNNGMDGDDWSRNNFETCGAGAIATRLNITDEVEAWLKEAVELNFEKFMTE